MEGLNMIKKFLDIEDIQTLELNKKVSDYNDSLIDDATEKWFFK